jgi:hypothetical protein
LWVPFQVTLSPPILGTSACVDFGILCEPSLVGAQFVSQWTTIEFTQSPCPLLSGLLLSDRRLVTIGQ